MTEENYQYRTDPFFLRNQFQGVGKFKMPEIPRAAFAEDELRNLLLIGFDRAKAGDSRFLNRIVHFFLYDYKFERVWKNPDADLEKLKQYKGVLSPDFSMYREMAWNQQLYNTFRNRWCGAYYAGKGIRVVPTVSWGDEETFEFCFDGIPKGSIVAVSTYMVLEHDNRSDQKEFFLKGYQELLKRIEPEKVICYCQPFEEMQGDIIYVDYELSGWKYMRNKPAEPSPLLMSMKNNDIIIKTGHVFSSWEEKGMGSAYGGEWEPKKEEDQWFLGEPNTIKTFNIYGYRYDVKYGLDGRAVKERHYTDHNQPWAHTNPHDHMIDWIGPDKHPNPRGSINYPAEEYPDGAPEFKSFGGMKMNTTIGTDYAERNRFESISDFKWCMHCNGEVEFEWKGKGYSITPREHGISISEANKQETEIIGSDADEILEYIVGGDRLRDVITQVKVMFRSI